MTTSTHSELPFEAAQAELEKIVEALENGSASLEESLAHYERGIALIRVCQGHLEKAQSRIEQLVEVDESGQVILKPFDHAGTAEAPPSARPGKATRSIKKMDP